MLDFFLYVLFRLRRQIAFQESNTGRAPAFSILLQSLSGNEEHYCNKGRRNEHQCFCSSQQTSEFPLVYNNRRTSLEETPFFHTERKKKFVLKNYFWNSRLSFIISEKNYVMRLFLQQTSKFILPYSNRKTNLGNIFF